MTVEEWNDRGFAADDGGGGEEESDGGKGKEGDGEGNRREDINIRR